MEKEMMTDFDTEISKHDGFSISEQGNLLFEECSLEELAKIYGTPCYIYSENIIRRSCREYISALVEADIDYEVIYAGKAFLVQALCKILAEEGFGLDASSGGEIYSALAAGFPAKRIYFHGNNKSEEEISFAIENNVGTIVIDNRNELESVNRIAGEKKCLINIMIRVTPGVDTHTHSKIRTGQLDSKFGFPISEMKDFFPEILSKENLIYKGLHCHIGSQLFETEPYFLAIEEMVQLIKTIFKEYQTKTEYLSLGGGLGVKYTDRDKPVSIRDFVQQIIKKVKKAFHQNDLPLPIVIMEPGRSIVAEAGITLYTVGALKEIRGIKKYLIVDGGMADNPRPSLYSAQYKAIIVNKYNQESTEEVSVAGKYCESGDILIQNIRLPQAEAGDLLMFLTTGAYQYSMASNYNGVPRPPVVLVNKGKDGLMVRRETYQYLNQNQVFPEWLAHK